MSIDLVSVSPKNGQLLSPKIKRKRKNMSILNSEDISFNLF